MRLPLDIERDAIGIEDRVADHGITHEWVDVEIHHSRRLRIPGANVNDRGVARDRVSRIDQRRRRIGADR